MPTPRLFSLAPTEVQAKGLRSIDFSTELTQQLHKDVQWDTGSKKGQPLKSTYYQNATTQGDGTLVYDTKICEIDWNFVRDATGFVVQIIKTLKWVNDDDTYVEESPGVTLTKDIGKKYDVVKDTAARMAEIRVRRTRIVEALKLEVGGILMTAVLPGQEPNSILDVGRMFLEPHHEALGLYENDANMKILKDLDEDPTPWLDFDLGGGYTIRQKLKDALALT